MQLIWSTTKGNRKTNELSKEVRHEVVEKHCFTKISKSLIIPLCMVKSIIKKWKMYHTTQIRSPIQTQLPGKQETGSGCHCKSNNDFERSPRLYVQYGGQCSSINNILFPSQSWPLWTGVKKEAITEKDASKSSYGVWEKHLDETADMWRNGL